MSPLMEQAAKAAKIIAGWSKAKRDYARRINQMTEKWYAFKAFNTSTMYGFGTRAEASKYQDYLNKNLTINHYAITPVKDPTAINGIEFNIGDALQDIKEPW